MSTALQVDFSGFLLYEISSILGEGEMPFNIFADEWLAEEVFERTENVYSGSIICETLTILV